MPDGRSPAVRRRARDGRRRGRRDHRCVARGRSVGTAARAGARRDSRPRRRAPAGERTRARRDRAARNGEAVEERGRRSRIVRRPRRLHGERRQPVLRQDDDEPRAEPQRADRARADRRLRRDHAVQQPAGRRCVEDISGARVRQRGRREITRAHAVHRRRVRTAAARRGAAERVVLGDPGIRT